MEHVQCGKLCSYMLSFLTATTKRVSLPLYTDSGGRRRVCLRLEFWSESGEDHYLLRSGRSSRLLAVMELTHFTSKYMVWESEEHRLIFHVVGENVAVRYSKSIEGQPYTRLISLDRCTA